MKLTCILFVMPGCGNAPTTDNGGNNGNSSGNSADTQSNAATAASVIDNAQQMLDDGRDVDATRDAMLNELQGKSGVETAEIDEYSDVIWADFDNGETQLFAIFDDESEGNDAETWLQLLNDANDANPSISPINFPLRPIAKVQRPQIAPVFPDSSFLMPASNKAILANGLAPFHDDWPHEDNRPLIAKMLTDIGYQVTQTDLTVEMFTHLSDYGVIYTESHGGWRAPSIRDLATDPFDATDPVPTCFGSPGNQWLLTTTEVTDANRTTLSKRRRLPPPDDHERHVAARPTNPRERSNSTASRRCSCASTIRRISPTARSCSSIHAAALTCRLAVISRTLSTPAAITGLTWLGPIACIPSRHFGRR
ncbi:MAG: hypothetical protein R3E58_03590 [Phycisphaerae bacterium]